MNESKLAHIVDPFRDMMENHSMLVRRYKEQHGIKIAGIACDVVPAEILASFQIAPLRIPGFRNKSGCGCAGPCENFEEYAGLYDYVITPAGCCAEPYRNSVAGVRCIEYSVAPGYGENAAEALHNETDRLLRTMGAAEIRQLDTDMLRDTVEVYNTMRRLVRGISMVRAQKPDTLSQEDLRVIFEAAAAFPPAMLTDPLAMVLDALNGAAGGGMRECPALMVSGSLPGDWSVLDDIEDAGCVVTEDDFCNGRRQFDLSHNASSEYLYYEILDACTYRPLCPSVRPAEERFELLYKMLKNYGIETVVFLSDSMCPKARQQMEYLRVRLMRTGIDPVILRSADAGTVIRDYLDAAGGR